MTETITTATDASSQPLSAQDAPVSSDAGEMTTISCSADISSIQIAPPAIHNAGLARANVTDASGDPFYIMIETTMNESLVVAKNRAYVDLTLTDDAALAVFQRLDAIITDQVYEKHADPEWFGKRAPRAIIADFCKSMVNSCNKNVHPFVRLNAEYDKNQPRVLVNMASHDNPQPDTFTGTYANTLEDIRGTLVVYQVQLTHICFYPTSVTPELRLHSVTSLMKASDFNPFDRILHNPLHREKMQFLEEQKQNMQKLYEERTQLESLQKQVNTEVTRVLNEQNDINQRYTQLLDDIQAAEEACSTDLDVDHGREENVCDEVTREAHGLLEDNVATSTDAAEPKNVPEKSTRSAAKPAKDRRRRTAAKPANVTFEEQLHDANDIIGRTGVTDAQLMQEE